MNKHPHAILIDGSGLIHRAWAMAPKEKNAVGSEIGATRLFGKMMLKLMHRMEKGKIPPSHIAVFFDPEHAGGWRRGLSADYKANRPEKDPELTSQNTAMRDLCDAMGVTWGLCDTHEADDMIAAYAEDARAEGMKVSIVSSDKDLMQLVRKGVMQFNPFSEVWSNSEKVTEKFGVGPEQVADSLALSGDDSDGVSGVPGIGIKRAAALLREFGSLDELLKNTHLIKNEKQRVAIETHAEAVRLARKLVALDSEGCPRPFPLAQAESPDPFTAGKSYQDWTETRLTTFGAPDESLSP